MERFSFGEDVAFVPRGDLLDRVTIAPLTAPSEEGATTKAAIFRFAPGDDSFGIRRPGRTSSPSSRDLEKSAGRTATLSRSRPATRSFGARAKNTRWRRPLA
jgi:hypothetical protein